MGGRVGAPTRPAPGFSAPNSCPFHQGNRRILALFPIRRGQPHAATPCPKGERMIWLEARVVDKLTAMRRADESYSDVILRLVEVEAGRLLAVREPSVGSL